MADPVLQVGGSGGGIGPPRATVPEDSQKSAQVMFLPQSVGLLYNEVTHDPRISVT